MHSSAPSRSGSNAPNPVARALTVCIVDPRADDYQAWLGSADAEGVRLKIVAGPEEALRIARTGAVDLWVINTALPGLSGYELCAMLKERSRAAPVYLVADEYTAVAEQRAWAARATVFGVKGAHIPWFDDWVKSRSSVSPTQVLATTR